MNAVRIELSAQADEDIENAALYYANISNAIFNAFYGQLQQAQRHIGRFPASGFSSYAPILNIPNLRFWMLSGFPYALFYVQEQQLCYVIRLVHLASDIPVSLKEVLPALHERALL
jgi:toxin ParE1/3/4